MLLDPTQTIMEEHVYTLKGYFIESPLLLLC